MERLNVENTSDFSTLEINVIAFSIVKLQQFYLSKELHFLPWCVHTTHYGEC